MLFSIFVSELVSGREGNEDGREGRREGREVREGGEEKGGGTGVERVCLCVCKS